MRKNSLTRHHYQSVDWERLIAVLTVSLRGLRQLASLTLIQPGKDLASQQVHSEYTRHSDRFEYRSGQMGNREDGSEGRGDLLILFWNGLGARRR